MTTARWKRWAKRALAVLAVAVVAVNAKCYRDRGTIYTPVFKSVEGVIMKYRCEYGKWPKSAEEVWLYIDPDYYFYVYESRESGGADFEIAERSADRLDVVFTGRSAYFGLPYRITREVEFSESWCDQMPPLWERTTLEDVRKRNERRARRREAA